MQEMLSKPGMPLTKDSEKLFTQLCQIIRIAKKASTPIHLLTGSVNEITLNKLNEGFKSILKVNFEFVPNIYRTVKITDPNSPKLGQDRHLDASSKANEHSKEVEMPGMKNRSKLTVVPLQALSGENSFKPQVELVKSVVNSKQTNSIMVIFSVRNFAKTSIVNIMIEALKNLPPRNISVLYDSPAKMNIALQGSNYQQGYHQNQRLRDSAQYTVVGTGQSDIARIIANRESKKDIRRYGDYTSDTDPTIIAPKDLNQIKSRQFQIPGMLDDKRRSEKLDRDGKVIVDRNGKPETEMVYIDDIEFLKYFNRFELELGREGQEGKEKQSIENMTMTKDEDNILYRGALAGIGLMIGAMHPVHKDTIQRLFQKGKIYMLLATDALGVKFAPSNRNI